LSLLTEISRIPPRIGQRQWHFCLSQNEYGLLRYIKKPFYPYPELRVKDCDYADNGVARIDEPGHIWTRRYD